MACASSMRSSSGGSSGHPLHRSGRRDRARERDSTSASAVRPGRLIPKKRRPWHIGSNAERLGSTAMAPSSRSHRSAASRVQASESSSASSGLKEYTSDSGRASVAGQPSTCFRACPGTAGPWQASAVAREATRRRAVARIRSLTAAGAAGRLARRARKKSR